MRFRRKKASKYSQGMAFNFYAMLNGSAPVGMDLIPVANVPSASSNAWRSPCGEPLGCKKHDMRSLSMARLDAGAKRSRSSSHQTPAILIDQKFRIFAQL
jgi:hypothetical protein